MASLAKRARMDENEDKLEKHDGVFQEPLQMFVNAPVNLTFEGYHTEQIHAIPNANPHSETYTFIHRANASGLIRINEAKLKCDFSFVHANGNPLDAEQDIVLNIPNPLRTMWKTKELKVNHTLLNPSSSDEHLISYTKFITTETPDNYKDSSAINLGIIDEGGHFNHNAGLVNNDGGIGARDGAIGRDYHTNAGGTAGAHTLTLSQAARRRHKLASTIEPVYMEDLLDMPLFNNNNQDVYIPTNFDIEIKLTRQSLNKLIMGSQLPNHARNAIANQKIKIENFILELGVYKPNDRFREAINNKLVTKNEELKYYTSEFRVITNTIQGGIRGYQATDIFNGSYPTRLYILLQNVAKFDGDYTFNCFDFKWHDLSLVTVKKNSNLVHPQLENSKQAYNQLKKVLNKNYSNMPFPYDWYENGYAFIAYDLSPNHDGYMKILPVSTEGNLSVELKFSENTPAGGLKAIFIGDFRNQLQISYKQEPRRLYDY